MSPNPPRSAQVDGEAGFLLIEVMVSAMLLIMVSLAVFTMLDQSDRLAGNNQKRAVAANLGQAEIERIRALPIEDIARLSGARTIREANTDYSVSTVSKWVTDGTDEPDCATRSGGLDYMRLSVSVGWQNQGNAKPVRFSTIVTPVVRSNSTTGSLSVYVRGEPVGGGPTPKISGLQISLSGPASLSETTNPNGCVVFPFIPVGNYTLSFSRPGYVTRDHVNNISQTISVTGGQTTKLEYEYDQGGTTSTSFETGIDGGERPTSPNAFSVVQGANEKVFALTGGATSWNGSATPLYPAAPPYQLYAGSCSANVVPSTGLVGLPGDAVAPTFVQIPKGGFQGSPPVRLPAYDIVVYRGTTVNAAQVETNAKVTFMAGCGASYVRYTNSQGRLDDPGFPYTNGTGSICVSGRGSANGTTSLVNRRYTLSGVTNNNFSRTPPRRNVFLGSAPTGSACAG